MWDTGRVGHIDSFYMLARQHFCLRQCCSYVNSGSFLRVV